MAQRTVEPRWCTWPHREYRREMQDLYSLGARCDAWRQFMQSDVLKRLRKLKGYFIWFNRYEYFDKLIAEFDCSETALRRVIKSLMREEYREQAFEFSRADIFDKRAWAHLPLSWFVAGLDDFNTRDEGKQRWQHEILAANEVPELQIGVNLPMTVTANCFTLTHRLKNGKRFAQMTFNHPSLDSRFRGKRWVADRVFPREATRAEMYTELMKEATEKCRAYDVTILAEATSGN